MSSIIEHEINVIVELLKPPTWYLSRPATDVEAQEWTRRLTEAERRTDAVLDGSPADRLALLIGMLDANAAENPLAPRLVSFIDENDLPVLVERLLSIMASRREGFLERLKTRLRFGGSAKRSYAVRLLEEIALQQPEIAHDQRLERAIDVAWVQKSDPLTALPTSYLMFGDGPPQRHLRPIERRHPTWHLAAEGPFYRMGGPGQGWCPSCEQPLIHLITIDQRNERLPGFLPPLVLETCPNCQGPAYYGHDEDGRPTRIAPTEIAEVGKWKNVPLKEQNVRLAPTPRRWLRQWDGNLFRFGGLPTWIADPEVPKAPQTEREMRFLLQLDSYLPDVESGSLQFGDGGLLYVFWDAETRVSCHFIQCY